MYGKWMWLASLMHGTLETGIGSASGYFVGFVPLQVSALYAIGIAVWAPSIVCTLWAGNEPQWHPPDDDDGRPQTIVLAPLH